MTKVPWSSCILLSHLFSLTVHIHAVCSKSIESDAIKRKLKRTSIQHLSPLLNSYILFDVVSFEAFLKLLLWDSKQMSPRILLDFFEFLWNLLPFKCELLFEVKKIASREIWGISCLSNMEHIVPGPKLLYKLWSGMEILRCGEMKTLYTLSFQV